MSAEPRLTPAEIRELAKIHGMPCPACDGLLVVFLLELEGGGARRLGEWERDRLQGRFACSLERFSGDRSGFACPCCGALLSLESETPIPGMIGAFRTIEEWEERTRDGWAAEVLDEPEVWAEIARNARKLLEARRQ